MAFQWYAAGAVLFVLGIFIVYFFRDPERQVPADPSTIVSPADGRIMEVAEEVHNGNPGYRITIFLSVFNVHVNRAPVAGTIANLDYRKGRFHAAMQENASENEQNVIAMNTDHGEVVFKQIAGLIARRILFWKSVGDSVVRGERVGMIRFGSRTDVWLPAGVEILVRPGQHVSGASTVIARWR